jgi:hypothetical protein
MLVMPVICDCRVSRERQIEYCALHRTAAEMLKALTGLIEAPDEQPPMLTQVERDQARAAVATAYATRPRRG